MSRASFNLHPRQAFTLLEVLLATALLTLLTVGILAVVADFGASKKMLQSLRQEQDASSSSPPRPNDQALASWVRLLEDDLLHAQTVDAKRDNELTLIGYAALDVGQAARSHRPVKVDYVLEVISGNSCLIRRQILLDVPSNQNVRRDLVCCGVQRFALTRLPASRSTRPAASPPPPGRPPTTAPSVPDTGPSQWNLRVWVPGRESPAWEQLLCVQPGGLP